jgi:hypothetical protein
MPVNFSFTAINVSNEAGCAAAFFLNFRSDYNPNNKSFSSKDPFIFARQVIITAWATDKYTI